MQIKTAGSKQTVVISRDEWARIGQRNGWLKVADIRGGKTAWDTVKMMKTDLMQAQHQLAELRERATVLGQQAPEVLADSEIIRDRATSAEEKTREAAVALTKLFNQFLASQQAKSTTPAGSMALR